MAAYESVTDVEIKAEVRRIFEMEFIVLQGDVVCAGFESVTLNV
jgi:hypothetical protein